MEQPSYLLCCAVVAMSASTSMYDNTRACTGDCARVARMRVPLRVSALLPVSVCVRAHAREVAIASL